MSSLVRVLSIDCYGGREPKMQRCLEINIRMSQLASTTLVHFFPEDWQVTLHLSINCYGGREPKMQKCLEINIRMPQ